MKTVWITNCHRCDAKGKVVTGRSVAVGSGVIRSHCTNCEYMWDEYKTYVTEYKDKVGIGPFPQEVTIPEDVLGLTDGEDIVGEITDQIEELTVLIEKQFLKDLMSNFGKLCYGREDREALKLIWDFLGRLEEKYDAH